MVNEKTKFKVVLGFDMETDVGSWTPFHEGMVHGTGPILDVLKKHSAMSTFFFVADSAVRYPEVVAQVESHGHEIGCHTLYHEIIGDELFSIPGLRPVLPEECFRRIQVATEMIQKLVREKIVSFRAPRLWGSTAMVNALEDLGYLADCTYPMYYHRKQLAPYHPSRVDWREKGEMRILEIPNFANMTMESHDSLGRDRDQWPIFRTKGASVLLGHVDQMLAFYQEKGIFPVICLYFHPWEFHPMPQGLISYGEGAVLPQPFIVENCGEVAVREFDLLLEGFSQRGAEFVTARQLAEEDKKHLFH